MLSIDVTNQQIFTAVKAFFVQIFDNTVEIIAGQQNLLSMPKNDFILLNQGIIKRLATNTHEYIDTGNIGIYQGTKNMYSPTEVSISTDIYGKSSPDLIAILQTVFKDAYTYDSFPINIKPLYITDPFQMPLIDGEKQYTNRWHTDIHLMYTPKVGVNQQYSDELDINLFVCVDTI